MEIPQNRAADTPRDSDAIRKNTNSRDNGSHNAALTAAPDTWLSGEAAAMADSLKRLIDQADVVVIGAGAGLSTSAGFHIFRSSVQEILRGL